MTAAQLSSKRDHLRKTYRADDVMFKRIGDDGNHHWRVSCIRGRARFEGKGRSLPEAFYDLETIIILSVAIGKVA